MWGCWVMGKERFSELRRSMEGISQRMLTLTLKELQQDGLIARTAYLAIPPRVEHELTKRGHSFLKPITKLGDWARQNRKRIQSARDKYDAQKPQKCARPSLILAQLLPSEADNRQPGSYQLARWVSTEKRASSDQPIAGGKPTYPHVPIWITFRLARQSVGNLGHRFPEARFWRASGSATRRPNEAIIFGSRCRAEVLPSRSRYRLMQ